METSAQFIETMRLWVPTPIPAGLPWLYGKPTRVVDGDTVHLLLEYPDGAHEPKHSFRLLGINAPEMHVPEGPVSKAYAEQWFASATPNRHGYTIKVVIQGLDDRGRFLADIWRISDGHNLSADMLASGQATTWP